MIRALKKNKAAKGDERKSGFILDGVTRKTFQIK